MRSLFSYVRCLMFLGCIMLPTILLSTKRAKAEERAAVLDGNFAKELQESIDKTKASRENVPVPTPLVKGSHIRLGDTRFYVAPDFLYPRIAKAAPKIKEQENAASYYLAAVNLMVPAWEVGFDEAFKVELRNRKTLDKNKTSKFFRSYPSRFFKQYQLKYWDENRENLPLYLEKIKPLLACLDKAAECDECYFPILTRNDAEDVFPALDAEEYLGPIREFANLRSLLAEIALRDNDIDEALKQIRLGFRIGKHLSKNCPLFLYQNANMVDNAMMKDVISLLDSKKVSENHLRKLDSILADKAEAIGYCGSWIEMQKIHHLTIVDMKDQMSVAEREELYQNEMRHNKNLTSLGAKKRAWLYSADKKRKAAEIFYANLSRCFTKPYWMLQNNIMELQANEWGIAELMDEDTNILPKVAERALSFKRRKIVPELARIAVAIRLYEHKYEKLPEKISDTDEFFDRPLLDEFTGKPYKMIFTEIKPKPEIIFKFGMPVKKGDGQTQPQKVIRLYSVGPNGIDEQGRQKHEKPNSGDDISITIKR